MVTVREREREREGEREVCKMNESPNAARNTLGACIGCVD